MQKLDSLQGDDWIPFTHDPVFTTEVTTAGTTRLLAAVPGGEVRVLEGLLACLEPPFYILYVLHTSRGEGETGRYQSPPVDREEGLAFLSRFAAFLQGDSRFDLWLHSPASSGTLVWERHNLLYGYGPFDCYRAALLGLEFRDGKPRVPDPHRHWYRAELDDDAHAVMAAFPWTLTPLRPADIQR